MQEKEKEKINIENPENRTNIELTPKLSKINSQNFRKSINPETFENQLTKNNN